MYTSYKEKCETEEKNLLKGAYDNEDVLYNWEVS